MADTNNILDELKKATEQVQQIACMEAGERKKYLDEVSKQYFELQKTVHSMISEEGIILNNFEWEWIDKEVSRQWFKDFINNKASLFAKKHGFSKDTVKKLLIEKNEGCYDEGHGMTSYYMLVPKTK